MKYGLPISILVHVIVGFSGAAFWVTAPVYDVPDIVEIRLEGIELGETTNLSEVVKPAPEIEEEAPPEEITDEAEEDEIQPVEQEAPPEAPPEEEAENALPDFEEKEEESEPEVKPEPEEEETPPPEEKKETPNVRKSNSGEKSLDDLFGETEKLLNDINTDPNPQRNQTANKKVLEDQQDVAPRKAVGDRESNTASVKDYIRAQIEERKCWRSVKDLPDWERLQVTIRIRLDAKGKVIRGPERVRPSFIPSNDKFMFVAEDRAIRAINLCDPFDMPEEDYDLWRNEDIDVVFAERF